MHSFLALVAAGSLALVGCHDDEAEAAGARSFTGPGQIAPTPAGQDAQPPPVVRWASGVDGRCLMAPVAAAAALAACGGDRQTLAAADDGTLRLVDPAAGCLAVAGGNVVAGAALVAATCDGTDGQAWRTQDLSGGLSLLRPATHSDLCATAAVAGVGLADCDASPAQQWFARVEGTVDWGAGVSAGGAGATLPAALAGAASRALDLAAATQPVLTDAARADQVARGAAMMAAVAAAAAAGDASVTIAPGDYRIAGNAGWVLEAARGLTVHAQGATLWFERDAAALAQPAGSLVLKECSRVVIEGLTIDYDPPVFLQGTVTALDAAGKTLAVALHDDFTAAPGSGWPVVAYKASGLLMPQAAAAAAATNIAATSPSTLSVGVSDAFAAQFQSAPRASIWGAAATLAAGDLVALPMGGGAALALVGSEACQLVDVTIYQAPGASVAESGGAGGHVYQRLRALRRPGTRRLLGAGGPGLRSADVGAGPTLLACEIADQMGDALDVYGTLAQVTALPAARAVEVTTAVGAPPVGGLVAFWSPDTGASLGQAAVDAADAVALPDAGAAWRLALDAPVLAAVGSLASWSGHSGAGLVVADSLVHDNLGAGLTIAGAAGAQVRNTTWQNLGDGILILPTTVPAGAALGPASQDITIVANTLAGIGFSPTDPASSCQAAMCVGMRVAAGLSGSIVHRRINIGYNLVKDAGQAAVQLAHTRAARLVGNHLVNPRRVTGVLAPGAGDNIFGATAKAAVLVAVVDDLDISGNILDDPNGHSPDGLLGEGVAATGVRVDGTAAPSTAPDAVSALASGRQGTGGWSAGSATYTGDYVATSFVAMPVFAAPAWLCAAGQPWPFVTGDVLHPGYPQAGGQFAAVRRWQSSVAGTARIAGQARRPSGVYDGVTVQVVAAGAQVWRQVIAGADTGLYTFSVEHPLTVGAAVDMVVETNGGNNYNDTTLATFSVSVLAAP